MLWRCHWAKSRRSLESHGVTLVCQSVSFNFDFGRFVCGFCFDICISLSFSLRFVAQRQKSIKIVVCANYIRVSRYIHFGYSRDLKTKTG